MPGEPLDEQSPRVTGASSAFGRPDPVSLRNIRAFVDALRTNTRGSDIPVSDEGIRRILELTCGQFNLRIEPKETIGLVGPTSRHRAKRVFFLRSGFSAGVLGILFSTRQQSGPSCYPTTGPLLRPPLQDEASSQTC